MRKSNNKVAVINARNQDATVAELGDQVTGIRGNNADIEDLDRLFAQLQEVLMLLETS